MLGRRAARRTAALVSRRLPVEASAVGSPGGQLDAVVAGGASSSTAPAGDAQRRVILTFSGEVPRAEGSLIWKKVAGIMKDAGANIETAGGSFLQMPQEFDMQAEERHRGSRLSVSAFGACIQPSRGALGRESKEGWLGCTLYIKALLPFDRLGVMMSLLEDQSPLEVYTVSLSDQAEAREARSLSPRRGSTGPSGLAEALRPKDARSTGTLYLFGVDRAGQLARITEMLREQQVTVLHLRVQSGGPDPDKGDFVPTLGGPLAENRIRIIFDESALDIAKLRQEIRRVGREVGYSVTCLITDVQSQLRAWLPSYLLRRRAFTVAYAVARAERDAESGSHESRRRLFGASLLPRLLPRTAPIRRGRRRLESADSSVVRDLEGDVGDAH